MFSRLKKLSGLQTVRLVAFVVVVWIIVSVVSCSTDSNDASKNNDQQSASTTTSTSEPTRTVTSTHAPPTTEIPLNGFETISVQITNPVGEKCDVCMLLAENDQERQQGLMLVTDKTLGGHDGMVFRFDESTSGGFWMKNTRLPLSIAYLKDNPTEDGTTRGEVISVLDMEPCPDGTNCPSYAPGGRYKYAIEVSQGQLGVVKLEAGSVATFGAKGCKD